MCYYLIKAAKISERKGGEYMPAKKKKRKAAKRK